MPLNAAAIPENLLENELFGHEKGAFTGAKSLKVGYFEMSQGGTFFLDEVGDLPLAMQAKLLRVLQEKKFYRLGGNTEIEADFRLIAATNKNLQDLVNKKLFREDLFYRLNVIPISVPPLRERPDDIPALINYIVNQYCKKYNLTPPQIDPLLVSYFSKLEWKGNVRELENTLTRMLVLNQRTLSINDIPMDIQEQVNPILQYALNNKLSMEEMTKMYANLVYEHLDFNKKEACKFLNINFRTLASRLSKKL